MVARPPRLVAHLDMDAFYASVELLRRPELRGQALVIGGGRGGLEAPGRRLGSYTGRGVVTTATYEARAFGVHSGMGLMKAAALAPHALLLPVDFDEYRRLSRKFKLAVARQAPCIEDRGIDEIYIDLDDVPGVHEAVGHDRWGGARAVAQELKNNVYEATGLRCSIGLANNKLLAKVASDLDKPDGLSLLMPEDLPQRYWPLPVRRIHGIGPKSGAQLHQLGIVTIGELAALEPAQLIDCFGDSLGRWLHEAAHGRDDRPVLTSSEPVSLSRETTFEQDLHPRVDRALLTTALVRQVERVSQDLVTRGYVGRTVGIKLRFDDFRTVTRDCTLEVATDQAELILRSARECLKRVLLSRRLRLLGVRVSSLQRKGLEEPAVEPPSVALAKPRSRTKREPDETPAPARGARESQVQLSFFAENPTQTDTPGLGIQGGG
jgi:DNA polymerase IV